MVAKPPPDSHARWFHHESTLCSLQGFYQTPRHHFVRNMVTPPHPLDFGALNRNLGPAAPHVTPTYSTCC